MDSVSKDYYDYIYKVIIIGDGDVGKSALMNQFCNKKCNIDKLQTTVGVDFQVVDIQIREKIVKLNLWDTAGQERYQSIIKKYYRDADAVILVFDLTNKESFQNISVWLRQVHENCDKDPYKILVGNKNDLELKIEAEEIQDLALLYDLKVYTTCAKDGENVSQTFYNLTKDLVELQDQLTPYLSIDSGPQSLFLHMQAERNKTETYCCEYI